MVHLDKIKRATEKFAKKHLPKNKPKKKRGKPEKEAVKAVLSWLLSQGYHVFVAESSRFGLKENASSRLPPGCPDILGVSPCGLACYIEVKSKKNKNGLQAHQKEFLKQAILRNGVGVCTHGVAHLQAILETFFSLPINKRPDFLLSQLPQKSNSSSASKSGSDSELDSLLGS